jgi:hypothetical protein
MLLDMGELFKKIMINDVKKMHENMLEKVVERAKFGFCFSWPGAATGRSAP